MTNKTAEHKTIVVIPAYQPGRALIESAKQLVEAGYEVVVVDDGSGADYRHIFAELNNKIHLIKHTKNRGKGAALKTGYQYIQSVFDTYVVITADADGQHKVSDIKKMAHKYYKHPRSLLLGVREFAGESVPFRSKFGNVLTRKVFSLITRKQLSDTQTGLRAFDQSLIEFMIDIPGERFEYEMDVLLACSRKGVDMVELPIQTIYKNNNATSHFNPVKDSWSIYKEVLKFASSSLLSFGIDYTLFVVLLHFMNSVSIVGGIVFANILSRILSASFNFTVNKHLIFRHTGSVAKQVAHYTLLAGAILVGNTFLLMLLTDKVHMAPYLAKVVTEVTLFTISYFVQKNVIFTNKCEEAV